MKDLDKKILLISHNPLSKVNNNGKTLVSIFEGVPKDNIYQIYLNSDIPDYDGGCHYLQLNEKQIFKSVFKGKNICCREVDPTPEKVYSATVGVSSFGIHTKRLLRELVWKTPLWKSKLKKWLKNKQFDIVFFMAGDGMFAYDIYRFVIRNVSAKGCMFFTDDYVIGKTSRSPIARLRQAMLKHKIKKTLPTVKSLYVISDEMKKAYDMLWDTDSCVIRNFSVEKKNTNDQKQADGKSDCLTIVYAGGLHYNRWKVLAQIANALYEIKSLEKCKCRLKIYSAQNISDDIINQISVDGVSEFCGAASASEIADIYSNADILLHIEAFDKKAIASTKYSFSTKIPEYLSAGKCVLAVGPSEVASLRYLSEFACTVSDYLQLSSVLKKLIYDDEYRNSIKFSCKERYNKDFSREKQKECLTHILHIE